MAAIIKPSRQVLFTDLAKLDPRAFPADRLDSQIQNLIDAIHSTQVALAEVRRDDGQLRMPPGQTRERADLSRLEGKLIETSAAVAGAAAEVSKTSRDVHLRVKDAEIAAFTSVNSLAAVERQGATAKSTFDDAENAADRSEYYATQSQNSANYSKAQTDNAISANVQATQWAEYLAGPVVNPADAPAYAAGHPFGHGLYYQPVEGGTAGLWSAKWWALYAQQLVGSWNFYYLGSWATPPVPGASNPATGVSVPSPLEPGSFYYNTELHQLFVWDGTQWAPPYVQVLTPGYQNSFVYVAIAGQTAFSGPDMHGRVPDVGNNPSDVHVAGLRLLYGSQYTVNATSNVLTLVTPASSGTVVQWDLLIPQADDVGGIVLRKVAFTPAPDGVNLTFSMTWTNPELGTQPVDVTSGLQLQITLDGIVQEPGLDYVATGATLTMGTAPQVNSKFWGIWFVEGAPVEPPPPEVPVNTSVPTITGPALTLTMLTATPGGWSGVPVPTFAYQWKSAGANVGLNQTTYTTVAGDAGKIITVVVTANNTAGSANATSANFGPIVAMDTTPSAFTFTDATNQPLSTVVSSNTITVAGINSPANMSITGGEYSQNGGAFASTPTTVALGDTVQVRGTSSGSNATAVNVVLTIGGVSDTFTITTVAAVDTTPNAFTFTDATNQPVSTVVESNTITVLGINAATTMSIVGGEYWKNAGPAWASTSATVVLNDTVKVRGTSSAALATPVNVTLTIGGVSDTFTITTAAVDTTPTAFSFTDVTGAALSTVRVSNSITVAGINSPATMTVTGGEYSKNAGSYASTSTTVVAGDTVTVRGTSSASPSTAVNVVLTIGGVSDTFTITTTSVALPVNSVAPAITPTSAPQSGNVLTTSNGTWSGSPSFAYQWKSGGSNVGTNATTYTVAPTDVGLAITCTVTATNAAGSVSATSAPTLAVVGPPAAPTLTITSATTDNTPDFTLEGEIVVADLVRLEYANNSGFTGATALTNTVDAAEDTAQSLNFVTAALADGTWYFRSRIERGALISGWSNIVPQTIATIATPTLTITSPTSDFSVDLTAAGPLVLADVVRLEYANNSGFTSPTALTNTVDAAEDTANSVVFATTTLAATQWWFRARIERGAAVGGWSATQTITLAAAAAYQGPGDIVTTGWWGWYGFRAFKASTRGTACIKMKWVNAPNTEQTFSTNATTGLLDNTAIQAFIAGNVGGAQITQIYDQSGNNRHMGISAGSGADGVGDITFSARGTHPALVNSGLSTKPLIADIPKPMTIIAVGQQNTGDFQSHLFSAGGPQVGVANNSLTPNTAFFYAGSEIDKPAPDNTAHVVIGLNITGTACVLNVDGGADGTPIAMAWPGFTGEVVNLGGNASFTFEGGFTTTNVSSALRVQLATEAKTFFGIT